MTDQQFEREKNYATSIYLINKMLNQKLLDKKEYFKICKKLTEKYRPILDGVLLENSLVS